MAIERNDTPYEQQNQAKTSWLGEDLFERFKNMFGKEDTDIQELADIDAEKRQEEEKIVDETTSNLNDFGKTINAPEQATQDPFAFAQKYIEEQNRKLRE